MIQILKNHYWQLITQARAFKRRQFPAWLSYTSVVLVSRLKTTPAQGAYEKNLLLLAWAFPPQTTGGVYRPASFTRYAAEAGWKTTVLTGPLPESISPAGRYLAQSIPASVSVHRVSVADKGPVPWLLPNIDGGVLNAVAVYKAGCKLLDTAQPGIIVASGPPFHNFVAAMWLANRYGWRLVLDYRDEWTESPFDFVQKDSTNRDWEIKSLRRADRVIFTTPSQLVQLTSAFPNLGEGKCEVVFNGWEPGDFEPTSPKNNDSGDCTKDKLDIAFLGNLGSWCLPGRFLAALKKVFDAAPDLRDHVRVHFIGKKSTAAMNEINCFPYPHSLRLTDHIPKSEACQIMRTTDALLLINPPSLERYIPGKTYEYIASGTPILVYGDGGEISNIINQLNAGLVISENDDEVLADALRTLKSYPRGPRAEAAEWLQHRTREASAHNMLRVLDDIRTSMHNSSG